MRQISLTEWDARLEWAREQITKRWPWLRVTVYSHGLDVDIGDRLAFAGGVRLDSDGAESMKPSCRMTAGGGLTGSLSAIENGLREIRSILDALHFAEAHLHELRIYLDGNVPCGPCRGQGFVLKRGAIVGRKVSEKNRVTCETCHGSGKAVT